MKLSSPVLEKNKFIPRKYTCQGGDVNPPLFIEEIPSGTKSLALIVDDPDAPMGTFVHWVVYDIPTTTSRVDEDSVPGKEGVNSSGREGYVGPCPPSGTHRYFFKVYALDKVLGIYDKVGKKELERAIDGHIIDKAELMGLYKKS